jgi:hypothetical protein
MMMVGKSVAWLVECWGGRWVGKLVESMAVEMVVPWGVNLVDY